MQQNIMAEKDKIMKKSGFKLKGWGGYQSSPVKQEGSRGTGQTYKQAWDKMSQEEKDKFGSLEMFEAKSEQHWFEKEKSTVQRQYEEE